MPLSSAVAAPFPDLVEESFGEAAFLWRRWEGELASPTRSLDEVWSWTEDRLHGALDGVRVAGDRAIGRAVKALRSAESDEAFVGAAVLASRAEPRAMDALTRKLLAAEGENRGSMLRALELLGSDQALRAAASVLASSDPARAAALCRLKAFRRVEPGGELATAFTSDSPEIQVEALRAARLPTSGSAEKWIGAALDSANAEVRYAAIESGLSLRMGQAWEVVRRLARQPAPEAGPCLKLLAMFGTARDHEVVYAALRIPGLQLPAIWALGHIGTVRAAEACLAGMAHDTFAPACGEAYCWITGADLAREGLALPEIPPDAPDFENDDLEADLVPPPEALWPRPDAEAVRRQWRAVGSGWSADTRYVRGRPVSADALLSAMERGPMLRRPDLAFELRVKTQGRYDVETRAFASRQRRMMAIGRDAVANSGR